MWKTLLLTWCINPKWVILSKNKKDLIFEDRIKQYIDAILYYISKSNFDNIVFCDNSNFKSELFLSIENISKQYNKIFEYISYDWNKNSYNFWYWYSECELIDYAVENSTYLRKSKNWYKITWRYIIKDINKLIQLTEKSDFYFHKQWIFDSFLTVSTSFFKINNDIYKKLLYKKHINLYQESKSKNYYNDFLLNGSIPIEKIWYIILRDFLIKNKKEINYSVPVYYIFPSSLPKILNNIFWECIRKSIYFIYYFLWFDKLFSLNHFIYDKIKFKNIYKKIISDKLI